MLIGCCLLILLNIEDKEELLTGCFFVCVIAAMIAGWPLMIMGVIMRIDYNNYHNSAQWTDIYRIKDCYINSMQNIRNFSSYNNNWSLIEYKVILFEDEINIDDNQTSFDIGVKVIHLDDKNMTDYLEINSMEICYKNMHSGQIMFDYPDIDLLQEPFDKTQSTVAITVGVLCICAPLTIALILLANGA